MLVKGQKKQFQYEVQSYQEECIEYIISIFEKLHQGYDFHEVLTAHHHKQGYKFTLQDSKNIDIMMETGTGKTFTFIKTIFELNRHFGEKKFIILIPTIPIREGTKTNLEDTRNYFKGFYANERNKEIETFVYEGGNISAVKQFISFNGLSVLIMTPSAFNSSSNILNRPLEYEIHNPELFAHEQKSPKSYLECLKRLNPIVIIDEPHRFDGDAFKKYFEGFDNYYLRFGATFPNKENSLKLSNAAYILDSISSFRQNLVKKIVVYTQDVVENQETLSHIENKKAVVNIINNGISIKKEIPVGGLFNGKSIKKINKDSIVLSDGSIEKVDYSLYDESIRVMIRETIRIHFEKERYLFEQGIKALTLFFMESDTRLFRGENPKIKNIFEEEFIEKYKEVLAEIDPNTEYYHYLQKSFDENHTLQVHKGYFSADKGKNIDDKIKQGVDEILRDKKKLLSFESPTRFIFSIWALQEGWDNPNVFTICKLSNQGSDISKLQQIGRGLRISVNQDLQRNTLKNLNGDQEKFWQINNLDIVVSNKEKGFVEGIQREILENSHLISRIFTIQDLKLLLQKKTDFNDITIRKLTRLIEDSEMIVFKGMENGIDIFEKSDDFDKILAEQNLPKEQHNAVKSLFVSDDEIKKMVSSSANKQNKKKVFIKSTHLKEFQDLWNTINKNAFYVLHKLNEEQENELIKNIKTEIESLDIDEILLQTIRQGIQINPKGKDIDISEKIVRTVSYKSKVDYLSLVQHLANNTKMPLRFVIKIFNALSGDFKNKMLCNNPAQAQKEISIIIQRHLVVMIKNNVKYDGIESSILPDVFKKEKDRTYLDIGSVGKYQKEIQREFPLKAKWVFDEVIEYDSDFELQIIEKDPDIEEIEIFGKLPRLKIKTPLGEYNPDFCYAVQAKNDYKVFLVVEAKGYAAAQDIPENEKAKIDFAKKYFNALNEHYKGQNIKITFEERINRTQLATLINKAK